MAYLHYIQYHHDRIHYCDMLLYYVVIVVIFHYCPALMRTVETLNNEHFETSQLWCNFTAIQRLSSLRGKFTLPLSCRDHEICVL